MSFAVKPDVANLHRGKTRQSESDVASRRLGQVEVFFGLGRHHLSFSYYRAEYEGANVLNRDIIFNGQIFPAGERITSSLNYDT